MRHSSCCGGETDFTELIQANYYATKETKTKPTTTFRRKISERKSKGYQQRVLHLAKLSSKKVKAKWRHHWFKRKKMKEFVARTPSLQEILEERFQAKKKKKSKWHR